MSINDQYHDAVNKFDMTLSVFGRARASSYPNRHFFMRRVLLQEVERKALRFLTPVTLTQLGMFSAVGALYGTHLFLQDLRLSNVASVLSTQENSEDIRHGTVSAVSRWRGRHNFLSNPAISWTVAFDFSMQTVGSTYSVVLNEAGRCRPVRPFRVLYKRMAAAEVHRWEGSLESRVQAKGWDEHLLRCALRRLPSVPQAHRWFLLKVHLNAPIATARLAAAQVVDEPLNCCLCFRGPDSLVHLPRCQAVLDVFDSIRGVAGLPPISDGRSGLMLQERWEGCVVAGIVAFYAAIWDVRAMCRRGGTFSILRGTSEPGADEFAMSMAGTLLPHSIQERETC